MPKYFALLSGRDQRWIYLQGSAEIEIIEVPDHLVADWARAASSGREAFPDLVKRHIVEGDVGSIVAVIDADGFSDFSDNPIER